MKSAAHGNDYGLTRGVRTHLSDRCQWAFVLCYKRSDRISFSYMSECACLRWILPFHSYSSGLVYKFIHHMLVGDETWVYCLLAVSIDSPLECHIPWALPVFNFYTYAFPVFGIHETKSKAHRHFLACDFQIKICVWIWMGIQVSWHCSIYVSAAQRWWTGSTFYCFEMIDQFLCLWLLIEG
jgi:hypothetical protein